MSSPHVAIRPFTWPLVLALVAVLFGQAIGVAFGLMEDSLRAGLQADADAVLDTVYGGDKAKAKAVVDKSWAYYKRAHLHGGALGTFALALTAVLAFLPGPLLWRRVVAIAVSAGSLGYGVFWWLAGRRAPSLGGTGAAKESLAWLAQPSSGAVVLGTLAAIVLVVLAWRARDDA